jgi:hypothetical protein
MRRARYRAGNGIQEDAEKFNGLHRTNSLVVSHSETKIIQHLNRDGGHAIALGRRRCNDEDVVAIPHVFHTALT